MQAAACRHSLDRRNLASLNCNPQHETRKDWNAINKNRAGSALPQFASVFGSGESEVFPNNFKERLMRRECYLYLVAVDRDPGMPLVHVYLSHKRVLSTELSAESGSASQ